MINRLAVSAALLLGASTAGLAQSPTSTNAPPPPVFPVAAAQPARPAPDMQAVLDAQMALGAKPIEALTPVEARIQPSTTDGAHAVMRGMNMSAAPDPAVTAQELPYGPDPMQFARIYRPAGASAAPMPVVIYYHGGGWVIADINTYDATP